MKLKFSFQITKRNVSMFPYEKLIVKFFFASRPDLFYYNISSK